MLYSRFYINCHYFIGYHDEELSFGVMKKGVYKSALDFAFKFIAEVICSDPHSSGFLIKLTLDRGIQVRL